MDSEILELAKKLIAIPSTSQNKNSLLEAITLAKNTLPEFTPVTFASESIPSLLFSNSKEDHSPFKIILNAHLDVVPGTTGQYAPFEKDGKLYGRGAYDMKSAAAVMILLFKEISRQVDYPLGLQITTDEESGGTNGTLHQIKTGVRAEFILTGEGTKFHIINEAKAIMQIKLTAKGKSAHSAYPWLGENAIWKMQQTIRLLYEAYPQPKSEYLGTTLNVISIHTDNQTHTRIPDHCEALLDIRVVPQEKNTILNKIRGIIGNDITLDVTTQPESHTTNPDNPYIIKLKKIINKTLGTEATLARAHGISDVRHFTAVGCDGIEFGPIGGNHHAGGEWVDIISLFSYYSILKQFLQS